jgi:acyl transferase domain-containing protein
MNWPLQGIRRVSVNCFGFGGTNAHVIMDEAPAYLAELGLKGQHNSLVKSKGGRAGKRVALANNDGPQLFCYSSNESSGVSRLLKTHASYLRSQEEGKMVDMQNYAYTLACRRSTLDWKTAVVATSVSELADKLESLDKSAFSRSFSDKKPRICFIFCGQGSQWAGMGKSLMKFEAFRESITAASWYMVNTLESTFDLIEEMFRDEEESRICSPEISQPATTALQIALVELLTSFQMTPQYVVGHSSGEIAAAFASGAITRESAWRVSYYRGLAAKTIPAQSENRRGGMVAVSMAPRQAEQYLASITSSAQVACINSPHSVTLSGSIDSIDFIANDLSQQKIFHRVLPVGIAYHSNSMRLVEHEYRRSLSDIRAGPNSEGVTMISSVTGEAIEGTVLAGPYWVENMVSPVNYLAAINRLMNLSQSQRPDIIIELSPHSTLRSPTAEILSSLNMKSPPSYFAVLHRKMSGVESLLQTLGSIWARGQHLQMEQVISRGEINEPMKCLVDLPPYPWNHTKSYWHESHLGKASRFREYPRQDLIGAPTADSTSFEPRWRGFLRLSENPWIQDHRVQKSIIYPAAGMISMVLEGAKQMAKGADDLLGYEILDMRIEKAMLIPSTEHGLEVALNVKRSTFHPAMKKIRGLQEFAIYSKLLDGAWEKHATGSLRFSYKDGDWESMVTGLDEDYESAKETCNEPVVPRQLYELLDTIGMNYGPLFRNITEIRRANNTCVSTVRIPNTKSKMPAKFEYPHLIHPATLDSMIQTLFAIEPVPMVPAFIERFFATADLNQGEASEFTGYSTAEKRGLHSARANITMRQQHSAAYITIEGLHLKSLETWMPQNSDFLPNHRNLCTEIIWKEDCAFATPPNLREYLELFAHKYPALSVLQIGGGFDLTEAILETLDPNYGEAPRLARLTVAEIENSDDAALALDAVQETAVEPFVETLKLDGSNRLPDYHLILAFEENVTNIDALKRRLLPGGCMLTGSMPMSPMEVSTSRSPKHPSSGPEHQLKLEIFRKPTLPPPGEAQVPPVVLLSPGSRSSEATLFVESLCDSFEAAFPGIRYAIMTLEEAISRLPALRKAVIISLVDVLEEKDEGFVFQWDAEGFESFRSLQKSTKAVVWITRGAHMTPSNPKMSPIVPLARTLMSEDPLKMILSLDLDVSTRLNDKSLLLAMLSIYRRTFCEDHGSQPREMEFAFKNGRLYIPRLATITPLNELIENGGKVNATKRSSFNYDDQMNVSGAGLRLAINELVPSENGPTFVEFSPRQAGPAEVEVVFTGAPLTPLDADVALGRTRKTLVGMDVIGRIKSVGSGVTDLVAGQEVVALVPDGSLQNILCVDRRFVAPFAKGFVPSLFVNAYYGLAYIGRIDSRRTVFVHAGASCFGIAAIQVCLHAGAEVYTSVVGEGSQQQRQVLERGGMSTDRIFDANSDKFIATIIEATAGVGVDIIYNPSGARMDLIGRLIRRGELHEKVICYLTSEYN